MMSAYHPDATDDHGTVIGPARELCARVVRTHLRYDATMHCLLNHVIEVIDDCTAVGEVYNITYLLSSNDDGTNTMSTWWGRHRDRYECRTGVWAIAHRACVHEWTTTEVGITAMSIDAAAFLPGSADRGHDTMLGPPTSRPGAAR